MVKRKPTFAVSAVEVEERGVGKGLYNTAYTPPPPPATRRPSICRVMLDEMVIMMGCGDFLRLRSNRVHC